MNRLAESMNAGGAKQHELSVGNGQHNGIRKCLSKAQWRVA
jgi:hypothetical protein